jgi:hypothetical protein
VPVGRGIRSSTSSPLCFHLLTPPWSAPRNPAGVAALVLDVQELLSESSRGLLGRCQRNSGVALAAHMNPFFCFRGNYAGTEKPGINEGACCCLLSLLRLRYHSLLPLAARRWAGDARPADR